MKKLLLAGFSGLTLMLAGSANAADMAVPFKAPPPVAPAYNWTGCYLGVHAGGGAMATTWTDSQWGGGGLAGGQIGCNYQVEHVVIGIEAEGWWSGLKSTSSDNFPPVGEISSSSAKNKWDFDLALRAGFAWDRALIYSKVGAAWGRFSFNSQDTEPGFFDNESASATLPGLLLGFGGEYAFSPSWSVKLEYNFIDYFNHSVSGNEIDSEFGPPFIETSSQSATKQIVKVGLNYYIRP
jgi:outer membrane immunogenic protein